MSRVAGNLDVGIPAVVSLAQAVEAVRQRAGATAPGAWIVGDGWGESKWPDGGERVAISYRGKSYEERGIVVSAGSDVGVTPLSPWWGIWSAVERKEYRTGEVLAPRERVDVETALQWYTTGGSYAGFEEKEKGVLTPGRLADLIVLDRGPLTVPAPELKEVRVLATLVGGEVVHEDAALGWKGMPGR